MNERESRPGMATEGVAQEWQEEHPAGAFVRWFPQMEVFQAKIIDLVMAEAGIRSGMTVLDIGSGGGIPALRLAEAVGPTGKVVATDPAAVSIPAIRDHARARGLANVEAVQASAAGLPFAPHSFDAAACHFGVMFFTDVQAGLSRIRVVLRSGGRAVFVAWGPVEENALFGPFRQAIAPYLPEPAQPPEPPGPDTPQPMRFAQSGSLSAALAGAGYTDIREDFPVVEMPWPGPPQQLMDNLLDVSRVEDNVAADRREAMRADILRAYEPLATGDQTHLTARIVIASGAA